MANYCSTVRTNYFHVKDPEKFRELMSRVYGNEESIDIWEKKDPDGNLVFGFGVYGGISGLRPAEYIEEGDDEEDSYDDFTAALQEHVAEDDAIIIMESGHEKLRYVIGLATVITSTACEMIDMTTAAKKRARTLLNNKDWTTECYC